MSVDTKEVRKALEACRAARGPDHPAAGFILTPWLILFERLVEMAIAEAEVETVTPFPADGIGNCAGCGRMGSARSDIPKGGVALHWLRAGGWVCLDCKNAIDRRSGQ